MLLWWPFTYIKFNLNIWGKRKREDLKATRMVGWPSPKDIFGLCRLRPLKKARGILSSTGLPNVVQKSDSSLGDFMFSQGKPEKFVYAFLSFMCSSISVLLL